MNFARMNMLEAEVMVQRKELSAKDTIISLYERKTGVFATNEKLMEQNFKIKEEIAGDCPKELKTCTSDLTVFKGRAKRRGWTIGVGIPVSIGLGYAAGRIYQSVK